MKNIVIDNHETHSSERYNGCASFDSYKNQLVIDIDTERGTGRIAINGADVESVKLHDGGEVAVKSGRKCYLIKSGIDFVTMGKFLKANNIEVGFF